MQYASRDVCIHPSSLAEINYAIKTIIVFIATVIMKATGRPILLRKTSGRWKNVEFALRGQQSTARLHVALFQYQLS